MIYSLIYRLLDHVSNRVLDNEQKAMERYLADATSHADLELRQREWDLRHSNRFFPSRYY